MDRKSLFFIVLNCFYPRINKAIIIIIIIWSEDYLAMPGYDDLQSLK